MILRYARFARYSGQVGFTALALLLAACAGDGPTKANLSEAARINTQMGVDYMRKGDNTRAREKLERALSQDANFAPAHATLALLYQQQGDYALADARFRKALELDPDNPDIRNNFGVFLCGRGNTQDADKYFMDAIANRRYSTPEAAWTNAGVCARSYDMAKAERDFREALRISPEFPAALAQMADISFRAKDYLHARAFIQRYEVAGKANAGMLWLGATTERQLGDELAARKYEQRLKRDFPDSPQAAQLAKSQEP